MSNDKLIFSFGDNIKDISKVEGVAYSGGTVKQWWSNVPLVVDLSGMKLAPQIPLLLNHNNSPERRLGVVDASIKDGVLYISGGIDTSTPEGKEIVEKGKKYDWQLSIGADIVKAVESDGNEPKTINGKEFKDPVLIATETELREVSVVAVGADAETHLKIAASFFCTNPQKGKNMEPKNTNPSPAVGSITAEDKAKELESIRAAETERVTSIRKIAAGFPELSDKAVMAGWTTEQTETIVNEVKAAQKSFAPVAQNVIVKKPVEVNAKSLEAALSMQAYIPEKMIEASCGSEAMDIADHSLRGIGLRDVMIEAARMEGKNIGHGFSNDTIRAAFSTVALPGILSNVANKKALAAYNAIESTAEKLCTVGDLSDFKVSERYRLNDIGDIEIVPEGGELKDGSLGEEKATNKLDTYGKTFTLTRQMIYNDDLGEFLKIPAFMGARAKRKIDQVFYDRLLSNPTQADGNALFSSAHKNYKAGASTAMSIDSIEKALTLFREQVDADGQPIDISAKYLLVPTGLRAAALRITQSVQLMGAQAEAPVLNIIPNYGLTVIDSPYLTNPRYANASETGFYLFGNPAQTDTFEIGYFRGRRTPTVEQGDTDFNTLGMAFRVYFDFGVREQDHRGMVFFKGKA